MSFDKDYPNRKDHRAPYVSGSKRFDRSCRNHESCEYCVRNRTIDTFRNNAIARDELKDLDYNKD